MRIVCIGGRDGYSVRFIAERVLDATRLAAVVVVHDEREHRAPTWGERARFLWRRLVDRTRVRGEAPPDATYDAATREVCLLGQRWRVPGDGELTLVLRVDRGAGADVPPVVTVRTVPTPVVPTEPIRVDPSASREQQRAQVSDIMRRRTDAESRTWGTALLADPEVAALVGPRLLEGMVRER